MNHSVGDCVNNTKIKKYSNGDIIELGTQGDIRKAYIASNSYSVFFTDTEKAHRVLERDLTSC